jgi:hypothetical protein
MTDTGATRDTARHDTDGPAEGRDPVPGAVDWLLGTVAAAVGLVLTAVGIGLYARVDRELIAEFVTAESTEPNGLTTAETITAGVPFVDWLSAGLAVTGVGLVVAALWFVRARRRTRHRVTNEGGTTATFWASAVYGAAVTAVVSFIPGAGVIGGGLAARLRESRSGARIGAAAGLVGWVLTVPLLASLAIGLLAGASAVDMLAGGVALAGITVGSELVALAFNVGAGALGGYVVDRFV